MSCLLPFSSRFSGGSLHSLILAGLFVRQVVLSDLPRARLDASGHVSAFPSRRYDLFSFSFVERILASRSSSSRHDLFSN